MSMYSAVSAPVPVTAESIPGSPQLPAALIDGRLAVDAAIAPAGVVAGRANLWRGPHTSDARTCLAPDYGAVSVVGVNAVPSAGAFVVWGQQVIGAGTRESDPAAATIHSYPLVPFAPSGVVIPALGEIVLEVGALAAGVAGVRDVSLFGTLA